MESMITREQRLNDLSLLIWDLDLRYSISAQLTNDGRSLAMSAQDMMKLPDPERAAARIVTLHNDFTIVTT